jgi:hypothetical protein
MKTLLGIYLVGAILTKIAIRGSVIDDNRLVLEWPLVWWDAPSDMFKLLESRFVVSAAASSTPSPALQNLVRLPFEVAPSAALPMTAGSLWRCSCAR